MKGRNKYNNKKVIVDGITFDSKKEAVRYKELKLLETLGEIQDLELQKTICIQPKYTRPDGEKLRAITYVADFVYTKDGKTVVEDSKGFKTEAFKIKFKLLKYKYDYDFVIT